MKTLFLLFASLALAQNPNTAVFPGRVATDSDLLVANNKTVQKSLQGAISAGATTITLNSTTGWRAPLAVTVCSALNCNGGNTMVKYCTTIVGNQLSGCSTAKEGTTEQGFSSGSYAYNYITAGYQNQIAAEIKAIEANGGGGGASLAIGSAITSSTPNYSLYADAAGKLAQEQRIAATRFPALTGDMTTPGGSLASTIAAGAVTLPKMANLAANSIIGNNTGSPATPVALNQAQATALLNTFSSTLNGLVPASGGGTINFLRADGGWVPAPGSSVGGAITGGTTGYSLYVGAGPVLAQEATLGAARFPALTGDVTSAGGSLATTIAAGSVTLAKQANLAANSTICNNTGSSATPVACSIAQMQTLLSIPTTGANIVSLFTGCSGSQYLGADGACHAASGSGTVTSVGQTFTGGLISVAGSPITTSGTLALTVAGTSGGIPYFSSAAGWASSALLPAGDFVLGGGAGVAPTATFSVIPRANGGLNSSSAGTGLIRDGTTPTASELSGDATTSGSNAVTVSKINGTAFAGTTGHGVCFGASNTPADCGVVPGANAYTSVSTSTTPTFTRTAANQEWAFTVSTSNSTGTTSGLVAGDILTFNITQCATTGGCGFTWPTGFTEACTIANGNAFTGVASLGIKQTFYWDGSAAHAMTPCITTAAAPGAGILRGDTPSASELSGDVTTSGSNVVTVSKVNGITHSATQAAHTVEVVTTANTTATAKVIPDCTDTGGNHLNFTQSTDAFSCGTSSSGGSSITYTSGTAYFPFGPPNNSGSTNGVTTFANGTHFTSFYIFTAPAGTFTLNKLDFRVDTGSGTGCTGGTCGMLAAIYNSTCTALVTNGTSSVIVSGSGQNLNTTGYKSVTFSPAVTLTAGTNYCLSLTSDSTVLGLGANDGSNIYAGIVNLNASRAGLGGNLSTGNGAALSPPASVGTLTPNTGAYGNPPIVMFE